MLLRIQIKNPAIIDRIQQVFKLSVSLLVLLLFITACHSVPPAISDNPENNIELGLTIYFIDVGQADAALIICDGAIMLIDGGNPTDSDLIYTFLKNHGITHLDYIVATHAHSDHVGGLAGALNYATAETALCPVTEYDNRAFNTFVTYLGKQGVSISVPKHGDTFRLGGADVIIVGPIKSSDNPNDTSIVIKITYSETSFLFAGDAERPEEQDILEAGYDLSATVLKTGHHGSNTSTTYPFLREIMPQYAIITCGKDNQYGYPHEKVLSRFRDADVIVYRTDMQGTITCKSDGTAVSFTVERNADATTNPTQQTEPGTDYEEFYIGNTSSKKFHRPTCPGLPSEQNRVILITRDEAINGGYVPCGTCLP